MTNIVHISIGTGENFIVDKVRLGESVEKLKKRIKKLKNIPIDRQTISFNGKALDPSRTLRQQMILHRSVLVMEGKVERSIQIQDSDKISFGVLPAMIVSTLKVKVRHWLGDEFTIDVEPTDYMDDVRETILQKIKVPVEHQRLAFQGVKVSETENVSEQGIASGCTLVLEPMQIVVELRSGQNLAFTVELDNTIVDIKKMINKETGVSVERQCLMFGGDELLDSKTLQESNVSHDDTLKMEEYRLLIMESNGEIFRLAGIQSSDTIDHIKAEICRVKHWNTENQVLLFHGKQLNGTKTLQDENIKHKSVLIIEQAQEATNEEPRSKISFMKHFLETAPVMKAAFKIRIKHWDGREIFIESDPAEYADDLKEKIQQKHGIPTEQQFLSFEGVPVQDDLNFETQHIANGSTLTLEPMRVFFDLPHGSRTVLVVEPHDTIRNVKKRLIDQEHFYGEWLFLMLGGKELDDAKCLKDYQVKHEDVLSIDVYKVVVTDASGILFDVSSVNPTSTVSMVKKEIMAKKSIPKERQRLCYQGKILNDNNSLADEGVFHKSVIVLEEVEVMFASPRREKFVLATLPTAMDAATGAKAKQLQREPKGDRGIDEDIPADTSVSFSGEALLDYPSVNTAKAAPSRVPPGLSSAKGARSKWWEKTSEKAPKNAPDPLPEKRKSKKITFKKKKDDE